MSKWIPCGDCFIEADVIRWREKIWERRGAGRSVRGIKIGERLIVAEVLGEPDGEGWVLLLVDGCEIMGPINGVKQGRRDYRLKKGEKTKRKVGTIRRGHPERLEWSDESVRSALVSKFLGNKEHKARFLSMDMDDED